MLQTVICISREEVERVLANGGTRFEVLVTQYNDEAIDIDARTDVPNDIWQPMKDVAFRQHRTHE